MDIVVSIKQVWDTSSSVDIVEIDDSGKNIREGKLIAKINDWDEYALTEAVQLKQKLGGTVTAITVGTKEWDPSLRRALAIGADKSIRIDQDVSKEDPYIVAKILKTAIQQLPHELVLFGAQSEDFGSGQLGVMVAEMLGIPHSALVVDLAVEDKKIHVKRELEAGSQESYTISLPALLTVQTGINRPRYISFANIKKAQSKDLKVISLGNLGLSKESLTPKVRLEKLELPSTGKEATLITGTPEESAGQLVKILKDAGVF